MSGGVGERIESTVPLRYIHTLRGHYNRYLTWYRESMVPENFRIIIEFFNRVYWIRERCLSHESREPYNQLVKDIEEYIRNEERSYEMEFELYTYVPASYILEFRRQYEGRKRRYYETFEPRFLRLIHDLFLKLMWIETGLLSDEAEEPHAQLLREMVQLLEREE